MANTKKTDNEKLKQILVAHQEGEKANLEGADLIRAEILQIGCEQHTLDEWKNFSSETISEMNNGALGW